MNPYAMLALLVGAFAAFTLSASKRWQILKLGGPENRLDQLGRRLAIVWRYAFKQERMDYYQPAGIAHKLIFVGFLVLLLRSLILWGRGFSPTWSLLVFAPYTKLGMAYELVKDTVAILVLVGVSVFFYYRVIKPQRRMTLSFEGLLILLIIATMMLSDMLYDGAAIVLADKHAELCGKGADAALCGSIAKIVAPFGLPEHPVHAEFSLFPSPGGSAMASLVHDASPRTLVFLAHAGFWTHSTLVLLFLNLLPHSKHFHVITAIPNAFLKNLDPPGRLTPMAESAEKLGEKVMAAGENPDPSSVPIGIARAEHFSWKAILDFFTCTECGRCSDNCPAHRTGKVLSPKHYLLAMRDHLYTHEKEIGDGEYKSVDLVPNLVHPDVIWACTTCRACEEQCPVMISYVDKIVGMRRNIAMVRGELLPPHLQKPFQGMEVNGNPWNLSRQDRSKWTDGLEIPTMSQKPDAQVLYWVGCAASYDDRAKKIARATAKLMKQAGVDFAILAEEENCTGDPARRAGNEFLFAMLAEGNAATLNGYKEKGGMKQVVTTCPHCFNTLKNEYPDFGCQLEVIHHTDFLLGLLAEGKLEPKNPVAGRVAYHDSCYLGRYNGIYESPREILRRIPGVELVEAEYWNKQRGLCCGAGGAQMWMEEQNTNRVNVKRTLQLVDALVDIGQNTPSQTPGGQAPGGAKTLASACPFCMTMLTDGLKSQSLEESIAQMDVAELLEKSCATLEVVVPAPPVVYGKSDVALSDLQQESGAAT
jgi:Fe-S oxidoreductase